MANSDAKPGDVVELKDKEGGFSDWETGFDISRDQQKPLGGTIGQRTHLAIQSGGLLIVKSGKKQAAEKEPPSGDLPEDLPGRDAFVAAGLDLDQIAALDKDGLVEVKGVGEKTAEAVLAYLKK
jgi:hypothetical protein